MTTPDVDAIRARADRATEGPWAWASRTTADGDEWAVFDPTDHALASNRDGWAPDAEFIAHARADIPALIGEVERLRAERDRLAATVDRVAAIVEPPHIATLENLSEVIDCARAAIEGTDS